MRTGGRKHLDTVRYSDHHMCMTRSQQRTSLAPALAAEVRAEAARQKISTVDLANAASMRRSTLSLRLNGHSPFSFDELDKIARALGLRTSDLMSRAETLREAQS